MVNILRFVVLANVVAVLAPAFPVRWTFQNVNFADGGTATGFFIYDADTNLFSNWDVTTNGGHTGVFFPFEFTPANSSAFFTSSRGQVLFASNQRFPNNLPAPDNFTESLDLGFGLISAPTDAGGVINIDLNSSYTSECFNCDPYRRVVSGFITGISYSNQRVTITSFPSNGCPTPGSTRVFLTSDNSINLFFDANVTTTDFLTNDWLAPDGSVIPGSYWNTESENNCYGSSFNLSNVLTPGRWTARVYDNGSLLFQVPYTINAPITTIFLIHGIAQTGADMAALANTLTNSQAAVDPRFQVDSGFTFSDCTSLEDGATKLGAYIDGQNPQGDVVLVGYSMGGLLARDLILHQRSRHKVSLLVTLATPNLGYPFIPGDSFFRCDTLSGEMFGDFRNPASASPDLPAIAQPSSDLLDFTGNTVSVSQYLANLNTQWIGGDTSILPFEWLAASGAFCTNPIRPVAVPARGCSDFTANDGVVCEQSARMLLNVGNGPTRRWQDQFGVYAHTAETLFCPLFNGQYYDMYNPPSQSDLARAIRDLINDGGRGSTANLSVTISPNSVSQSSDGNWYYTVTLQETNGVGVSLQRLTVGGTDYSQSIGSWFNTTYIGPYGQASASMSSSGYSAPITLVWDFAGTDDSGHYLLDWPGVARFTY